MNPIQIETEIPLKCLVFIVFGSLTLIWRHD